MKKIRSILHVGPGLIFGGIERHLVSLAGLNEEQHGLRHLFALTHSGVFETTLRKRGAQVHRLPTVRTRWPWTRFFARKALARIMNELKPDVVMAHGSWTLCHFGSILESNPPFVFWLHDFVSQKRWLDRWAARRRPNLILCNSEVSLAHLELEAMYREVPKQVLHPAVTLPDPEDAWADRKRIRKELGVDDATPVVVQAGRLTPSKGHDRIIEAMALSADLSETWQYWIVGGAQSSEERKRMNSLEDLSAALGLADRIRFLGHRDDVAAVLHASEVCVHPCQEPETFGLVLVEALAAGIVVVASDLGGAREILKGGPGHLVSPNRAREWRQAISKAMEEAKSVVPNPRGRERALALCDPAGVSTRLATILDKHV